MHCYVDRTGVPSGRLGQLRERGASLDDVFGGRAGGHPTVAPSHHAFENVGGVASQHHRGMRFLRGLGLAADLGEIDVPTVEFGGVLGPQFLHGQHVFPSLSPTMVEVRAHYFAFLAEPAGADAEDEPASRIVVQGGDLLGQVQGIVLGDQADASAQFQGCGGCGGKGQADEWVDLVAHELRDGSIGGPPVFGVVINGNYWMFR